MTKESILNLNLSDEERARVEDLFKAYERFAVSNPAYPVPFADCDSEAVVRYKLGEKIKQHNKAVEAKQKKLQKAAEKKAAVQIVLSATEIALAKGIEPKVIANAILAL